MTYRISVDTGGTFTDVVVSDGTGSFTIGKALTTPDRIFDGMRNAMAHAAQDLGITLDDLLRDASLLIYGTTRATNAIVTGTVARTALLTTEGFPDVLVLKEGGKFNPHDFSQDYPQPYIPRRHTFEIEERIGSEGQTVIPLNLAQARKVIAELGRQDFGAVAVCFLWSIANPAHELQVGALIEEILPGVPYTLSHQLIPVVREYRRASATAIDASLKPLMQAHLR
ncbi:MAG TPA: hydantoinase/oxoprolinase N-terminal domain-containing protein, partial [Inquilinus sp.]